MNIFCDTNILLEYLQQRTHADEVEKVLNYASDNNCNLYISVGEFYTLTYLIERFLRQVADLSAESRDHKLRSILISILNDFMLAPHSLFTLRKGIIDEGFRDLEDSYQLQAALASNCDVLLTINDKDFKNISQHTQLSVQTPKQFIENYI